MFQTALCTLGTVPANRADIVTSYVRERLRALEKTGDFGWKTEVATIGQFSKSTIPHILSGKTGVGTKTGPGFARALGFSSYEDLQLAALHWWEDTKKPEGRLTDAMRAAVEAVSHLGTPEQVRTVLSMYSHPVFRRRDRGWWVVTLTTELTLQATPYQPEAKVLPPAMATHEPAPARTTVRKIAR